MVHTNLKFKHGTLAQTHHLITINKFKLYLLFYDFIFIVVN